jgi:hypothetical protein
MADTGKLNILAESAMDFFSRTIQPELHNRHVARVAVVLAIPARSASSLQEAHRSIALPYTQFQHEQ